MLSTRWSLLRAAQRGDADALSSLCHGYRAPILAYLERQGLGSEAEDVTQEVLLGLVDALPRVRPEAGRFRSLVFAVARNKLAGHARRRDALKRGGGGAAARLVEDPDMFAAEAKPDDAFDREWLDALVRRCLARLRSDHLDQFEALKAFILEERPQAEIAVALGVTPPTIRKRVWRGKRNVAAYLREEVGTYALSPNDAEEELRYLSSLMGPLGATP